MKNTKKDFTVVMSVYKNDNPNYLKSAINSLIEQTLPPTELIIISDGPLTIELNEVINSYSHFGFIKLIKLCKNVGLALSRKEAIKKAKFNIIAVMDSDDICVSDRFEKQIELIDPNSEIVVSGWIEEFDKLPGDIGKVRKTPTNYENIVSYGKWRNPINHVTLMFTKKAYEKVGGYSSLRHSEDWDLISRMLVHDVKVIGIPKVVVHVRAGDEMIERRRNIQQFKGEIKLFFKMYKIGYLNIFYFSANILVRVVLRVLPTFITRFTYKNLLRKKIWKKLKQKYVLN